MRNLYVLEAQEGISDFINYTYHILQRRPSYTPDPVSNPASFTFRILIRKPLSFLRLILRDHYYCFLASCTFMFLTFMAQRQYFN